ncbi:TonB-linked outer membrane protein, SusC/RagA family [Pricia antarctica]|uniref:TonB-linked outer membrane protein, SusC/RagA family n=1 Tax=Pricia antarctica TaxID=641691 RepID=A0A1G7HUP9_9FLAO|nr:TonB-dependent receptor [Pricia antarctica]SDF04180.1 TonB-linked outer membrane protein, SusC/RagA family [Pricia antarctica]
MTSRTIIAPFILFLFLAFVSFGYAQQRTVSGQVTTNGELLPGVNVVEKGTTNGVSTDFDGNYTIDVGNQNAVLVFSYLGFESQEAPVGNRSTIDVSMEESNSALDEVVVVGYGTQRKRDVVGAISSVKTEELVLSSTASIGQVLQGKVAGLQVTQNSAQPGGGLNFLIRGAASINASNQPLIVVDGFPITDFQQPESGNQYEGGTQNILNSFNPNDIDDIQVLKDASSTSIYGARAANGVILITTKKGVAGKIQIDYSSSLSLQDYNDAFDVLKLKEWMEVSNESAWENWSSSNRIVPYGKRSLDEAIADPVNGVPFRRVFSDNEIRNPRFPGTDWLSLTTRDGFIQQHNLSVRGGNESTKYFLSGNLFTHKGVLRNSEMDRSSLRFNLDQKINKYISFGLNLTKSRINNQNTSIGDEGFEKSGIIRASIQQSPYVEAIDEFGNYPINPKAGKQPNPFSLLNIADEGVIDRTLTNFYVELKPIKGLTARVQAGIDQGNTSRNTYIPKTVLEGAVKNGQASIADERKNDKLLDITLNYTATLNENHNLTLLAGYSTQNFESQGSNLGNNGFLTDAFLWNNINSGAGTKVVGSFKSQNKFVSYFSRLNYVYKDRYILTSTVRRDGASVFAENNKYALFPSFAIGWDIAEEPFMENVKDKVSQLKFRFGYGSTGNADIGGNAFAAYYAQPAYLNPDESLLIGVFANRLANPDLKWETTTERNFGLDFELYRGRVSGSVEVYNKDVTDLLSLKPINSYNEINVVWANIGATQSKGVEVTLNTYNIDTENFKWRSILTYSKYEDRWKERAPDWKPSIFESVEDPIRPQFSYLSDGIMQIGETVPAQPLLIPGGIKIKDVDGFAKDAEGNPITDENSRFVKAGAPDGIIDQADIVLLGSSDPDFLAGFSNIITYKNLELNFHFNGMFGRRIENQTDLTYGVGIGDVATSGTNVLRSVYGRWTPTNPSTTRPSSAGGGEDGAGDFWLQDAWFIRLQYASLSYKLPKKWFGGVLRGGALRLDANNLFTITPYDGVDPETDNLVAAYPNVSTYTVGIDLKF